MQLKRLLHQHGMCLVAGHMGLHLHHGRGKGKEERPQSCRVHISEPQPLPAARTFAPQVCRPFLKPVSVSMSG